MAKILLALTILEAVAKHAPTLARAIAKVLQKKNPTPQDWADLRAKAKAKKYEDYTA